MMQPRLIYLHLISLVACTSDVWRHARGTKEMMQPLSNLPTSHLFGGVYVTRQGYRPLEEQCMEIDRCQRRAGPGGLQLQ